MAQAPLNKLCLARRSKAFRRRNAGRMPCNPKNSSPPRPDDISAQRKFVIWLANKVRETNLFSSFGYGENSRPWANTGA